jgi:hypothetical protein
VSDPLPAPSIANENDEPLVEAYLWTCACGCTSHYLHEDGRAECVHCAAIVGPESGGWRAKLADPGPDTPELGDGNFRPGLFGQRSLAAFLQGKLREEDLPLDRAVAVVFLWDDGSISSYRRETRFEDANRRTWLLRQLRSVFRALTR